MVQFPYVLKSLFYLVLRHVTKKQHPSAVRPLLPEIEASARFNYFDVLHPILRLLALGMELSEDTFVKHHDYGAAGETYVRFTKYHPRSQEDEEKTNVWLKVTQIINIGDTMEFLSADSTKQRFIALYNRPRTNVDAPG
ncbi:hypothetical protein WOLCODRAFT_157616 [Wolfiporia cocos MD-104 SS10]|uniref:Uncharacterized protein n=1 Tax=Wolfiporia cocos (strain MD-104) TaxID=742152 RepID=A0A2H3JLP9_WOLCO|nr:hypothetical protein WOLCODRAFT_157616 [Wolfiporia cocos MD-104 SS10]